MLISDKEDYLEVILLKTHTKIGLFVRWVLVNFLILSFSPFSSFFCLKFSQREICNGDKLQNATVKLNNFLKIEQLVQ